MRNRRASRGSVVVVVVLALAACADRPPESSAATDAVAATVAVTETTSAPPPTDPANTDPTSSDSATTDSFRSTWSNGAGIRWSRVTLPGNIYPRQKSGNRLLGTSWDSENEEENWWESDDHGHTWARLPTSPQTLDDELGRAEAEGLPWLAVSPDDGGVMMGSESPRQVLARTWVDAPGDPTLHRLHAGKWEQVDLSSFAPRSIPGLGLVGSRFAEGATLDADTWIVPMVSMFRVPWKKYYGDPEDAPQHGDVAPWPIWDWSTERLGIHAPGETGRARAVLTVDLQDTGSPDTASIVFRDAENGRVVHTVEARLPGWEPEALLTALRGWGLDDLVLIVGNGDEVAAVRPPFPMGEEWGESVVAFKDAFYTYSYQLSTESETRYTATALRLWRSEDGVQWSPVPSPPLQGNPLDWVSLIAGPNELMMTVHQQAGESLWTSTNGSHWQQADTDAEQRDDVIWWDPLPTEFGWIRAGTGDGWVSEDGLDWESIDLPPAGGDFPMVGYFGGVYFSGPWEESGENVIWVGQYEPATESSDTAPPGAPTSAVPPPSSLFEVTDYPTMPTLWVGVRGLYRHSSLGDRPDMPIEPGGDVVDLVGDGVEGQFAAPPVHWRTAELVTVADGAECPEGSACLYADGVNLTGDAVFYSVCCETATGQYFLHVVGWDALRLSMMNEGVDLVDTGDESRIGKVVDVDIEGYQLVVNLSTSLVEVMNPAGEVVRSFDTGDPTMRVYDGAWSADRSVVVVAASRPDGTHVLYGFRADRPGAGRVIVEAEDSFRGLVIDVEGRLWYTAEDRGLVADPLTGKTLAQFDYGRNVVDQNIDESGHWLIVTFDDGSVRWRSIGGALRGELAGPGSGYTAADW